MPPVMSTERNMQHNCNNGDVARQVRAIATNGHGRCNNGECAARFGGVVLATAIKNKEQTGNFDEGRHVCVCCTVGATCAYVALLGPPGSKRSTAFLTYCVSSPALLSALLELSF
jgi:hypothetical protein